MFAILKREVKAYFQTVTGWLFIAAVLVLYGLYFYVYNLRAGYPYISYSLSAIAFIMLITVPVLTMRSFAEERHSRTEAILVLSRKGSGVRSVDIATMLGVSKPSVSHAMKLLREDGYIAMDRYGTVTLMEKGAEIANRIYERHTVLTKMLEGLGVNF